MSQLDSDNGVESPSSVLADLVDRLATRMQAGEDIDWQLLAREHPGEVEELRHLLPALGALDELSRSGPEGLSGLGEGAGAPESLGDYRILGEIGRGGMGIVYEAEQLSLGRRVALKILPLAGTLDPRQLQRFHNEARAAACLHHGNIVPVFSVGCERGIHFYAMQLIDGQPLSDLIHQLRRQQDSTGPATQEQTPGSRTSPGDTIATRPTPIPAADGMVLTGPGRPGRAYYRKVAELGVQAAEALDHAHQVGIVHRDVKPGNLMLDGGGRLWVTDFGLAHMQQAEASLTLTGQALGTPRYMSPEQALARRAPIDHRTDIYSLGVTLYELLTLQPAFAADDRQELLRQIASEDPVRPRRLERGIPSELEIIVLKALEKRPQDRYITAQELADDLQRWLRHEPIRARRPSLLERCLKWERRHRPAVAAGLVVLLMVLGMAGWAGWSRHDRALRRAASEQVVRAALDDSYSWQEQRRLPEALSAARRAAGLLAGGEVSAQLRQQAQARLADLELLERLESVRLEAAAEVKDRHFDFAGADARYRQRFLEVGLDVEALSAEEAGERIGTSTVAVELAAVLDHWAWLRVDMTGPDEPGWKHLLGVARRADPDSTRTRVRLALEKRDPQALRQLVASEEALRLPPITQAVLGQALFRDRESRGSLEQFLRAAQRQTPNDFWLNETLFDFYDAVTEPPQREEALRFAAIAVALRPESPARLNLGKALKDKGNLDEAIAEYHKVIQIKKDFADAYVNLGNALQAKGRLDEAIVEYRKALQINKNYADGHYNLGVALHARGKLDEAIAEYHRALQINKDHAPAHCNLGVALRLKGQLDEAIAEYRKAIHINKDYAEAHYNLGNAHKARNQLDEAIAEYRKTIQVYKNYADGHYNLGVALHARGKLDEAIAEYRKALEIKKDDADAHVNLGNALKDKGRLDEAIAEYHRALQINKDHALAHCNLGMALRARGRLDEAIAEYRKAIQIKKDYAEAHNNLGNALHARGHLDEAIAECRKAIQIKKDDADAYVNLGIALKDKGQLDEAIAEYRKALRINKDRALAHSSLGVALHARGQLDEAIAEYRKALQINKDQAPARYNLGLALRVKGQLAEAIAEFRKALQIKKDFAEAHYTLGNALQVKGQLAEAITAWRKAIHLNKDFAEPSCNLGLALLHQGQFAEALPYLRRGHQLGSRRPGWSHPSAQWVRHCERLLDLDRKLPDILAGQKQPDNVEQRLGLAQLCRVKQLYADAVRFYREAFADRPQLADDLTAGHRYTAARSAALAGCGQGKDADRLDDKQRTRLRQQALDWLRADLAARDRLAGGPAEACAAVRQHLQHWQEDGDLAGVRGEALARMPVAERPAWRQLWADVEKTLSKAQGKSTPKEQK
jgi:tetratricopeptide (TPR) repeat protein